MVTSRTLRGRAAAVLAAFSACALVVAYAAPQAQAQAASDAPSRPADPTDPTDPKARVPALRYTSSLRTAAKPASDKAPSWREANDAVTRIGGWRAYAREAQQPDPPPANAAKPAPSTARPAPPPMPHGHPGSHGQAKP